MTDDMNQSVSPSASESPPFFSMDMVRTLLAVFMLFSTVMLVIAAAPVAVDDLSDRRRDAALVTALFSGCTVGTQLLMPRLLRTEVARWTLSVGLLIMGMGAVVGAIWPQSVSAMFAAAAFRGLGFGIGSVTSSLFVVTLASVEHRGRALGYYGVAATVPAVFGPSTGLLIVDKLGVAEVFSLAAALAIIGALAAALSPGVSGGPERPSGLAAALRHSEIRRPFVAGLLAMVVFGGLLSYAPLALPTAGFRSAATFFLLAGAARAVARWASGPWIDRRDDALPLLAGLIATTVGAAFLIGRGEVAFVLLAAIGIGAGLGVILNAAYIGMIRSDREVELGLLSTLWNISIDGGVALGALGFGLVAAHSIGAVFVLLPFVVALAIPMTITIRSGPTATEIDNDSGLN